MSSICGVRWCSSLSRRSGWTEVPGRHPGTSDRSSGDLQERGGAEEAFRGRVGGQQAGAPWVKPDPAARLGRVRTSGRPLRPRLQHPLGQNDHAREGTQCGDDENSPTERGTSPRKNWRPLGGKRRSVRRLPGKSRRTRECRPPGPASFPL